MTKTDLFYEGQFMGSFGSPWVDHSSAFMCVGCGRKFAERKAATTHCWSFNDGFCWKCAKERIDKDPYLYRSLAFFRLGGEVVHPFECPLIDAVQFIYEADCLLGVPEYVISCDPASPGTDLTVLGFFHHSECKYTRTENPPDGG